MTENLEKLIELKNKLKYEHLEENKKIFSARERLNLLFDEKTFVETGLFINGQNDDEILPSDGVITGYGQINGRLVYAVAQDKYVLGGAIGVNHIKKIITCQNMSLKLGTPIIYLCDSSGIRLVNGLDTLNTFGELLKNMQEMSGVVLQISACMGMVAGIETNILSMSDAVFMINNLSKTFVNAPRVLEATEKINIDDSDFGSAKMHSELSGLANFLANDESECIKKIRTLISYLPQNNMEHPEIFEDADDINKQIDEFNNIENDFDMKNIITNIVDYGQFFEYDEFFAKNIITGFAKFGGIVSGIIANNRNVDDCYIDINACKKATKFIRICDAFNIPIVSLVDTIGVKIDINEEQNNIAEYTTKLCASYGDATVPIITIIIGKAIGQGYLFMGSKSLGADIVYAWPNSEISVLTAEAYVSIMYENEIKNSNDIKQQKTNKINECKQKMMNPYIAAKYGYVDDVIVPSETRKYIISAIDTLMTKEIQKQNKKHSTIM